VVNEAEAVGDGGGGVAGKQRLFQVSVGTRGLRRSCADHIADYSDNIRLERSQNVAVTEVAVKGNAGDDKFGFSIVEPADGVLLPEGGKDQAARRGDRQVVSL
jgi:hypothetical protein